ncbi:outer membrane protein assembly factor BamC [Pararobbsia silviterrae]|uniref:Outer membrane protein assembly factor BamC n=1 Tax=Pararobbsia silviterrae TaxID=1792498 RepID=A0A494XI99_9BURK|nr:outer membrane protein assembly factor BamC [Pararobbsia silviterrae]RKP50370.1 outer membrane protein assembly factor BamC [Pararobbsia silviterrae]
MKFIAHRLTLNVAVLAALAGLAAGCSAPDPHAIEYKSSEKPKTPNLAAPPDLTAQVADQRLAAPTSGEASLSSLTQTEKTAPKTTDTVLPSLPGVHLQRDGNERWLVVDGQDAKQLWPQLRKFWQQQGFLLAVESRKSGVMETDWNEKRPSIDAGFVRNFIGKSLDSAYTAASRYKYRTRLEAGPDGSTYVFISERGLTEQMTGQNNENREWAAAPNDPTLEVEYLRRLMTELSYNKTSGQPIADDADAASGVAASGAASASAPAAASAAHNTNEADAGADTKLTEINMASSYDRAWLAVGVALDRASFTVDDKDRTKGLYFIRYVDPNDHTSDEQGFWSQLFHGHKDKEAKQYRLNVRALTESTTRVAIVDESGKVVTTPQAQHIVGLLSTEMH